MARVPAKRKGRVKRFLRMKYGDVAFTKTGEIKMSYLIKAKAELLKRPTYRRPKGLLQAINWAIMTERRVGRGKPGV